MNSKICNQIHFVYKQQKCRTMRFYEFDNGQKFENAVVEIIEFASKRFDKLEKVIRDT